MKPIVVKVYDPECQQCIEMHPVERAAREEYGTEFLSMDLEFAAMHEKVFTYISDVVADEDGNLTLPCYLFLDKNDRITGHFTGKGSHHDICGHSFPLD